MSTVSNSTEAQVEGAMVVGARDAASAGASRPGSGAPLHTPSFGRVVASPSAVTESSAKTGRSVGYAGVVAEDGPPQRRHSVSRRGSLATVAFQQNVENRRWLELANAEMSAIERNSEDMAAFLRRRQSWKAFAEGKEAEAQADGRSTAPISYRRRQSTQLRESVDWSSIPPPQQISPVLTDALQRGSAILEHARRKDDAGDATVSTSYFLNHTLTSATIPSPARGSARPRRKLSSLAKRLRPGTAEPPESLMPPPLPRSETPEVLVQGAGGKMTRKVVGATLPPCSDQSPVYKYGGIKGADEPPLPLSPERVRGMVPTERDAFMRRRALGRGRRQYFSKEHDKVTVVTGTVDYASLLEEQVNQRADLAHADVQYVQLMDTLDKINYTMQRKFSKMLKQENLLQLTGLANPGSRPEDTDPTSVD
eukprot:TRINITY_DN1196_c5_g2_i4.p1 TRINITY_DN1196_c5_g2~~TRINITY_DN1196_c5_g2_i4.p1  ORF type:complete len:424 (+),score=137.92 TRINITY_DN1196_c5_g2_i4:161-1432(+)